MCWMKLHHQLLFEPGRTPALVLLSGHPPSLHRASEGCTGAHSAKVWATSTPWWVAAPTHPAAGSSLAWEWLLISPSQSFVSKPLMHCFPLSILDRKISQRPRRLKNLLYSLCFHCRVKWDDYRQEWFLEHRSNGQGPSSSLKAGLGCMHVEAGVSARQVSIWNLPC